MSTTPHDDEPDEPTTYQPEPVSNQDSPQDVEDES